jgi:hypothetical protein
VLLSNFLLTFDVNFMNNFGFVLLILFDSINESYTVFPEFSHPLLVVRLSITFSQCRNLVLLLLKLPWEIWKCVFENTRVVRIILAGEFSSLSHTCSLVSSWIIISRISPVHKVRLFKVLYVVIHHVFNRLNESIDNRSARKTFLFIHVRFVTGF